MLSNQRIGTGRVRLRSPVAATLSVHFYDSIVVYERGRRTQGRSLFSDREGLR